MKKILTAMNNFAIPLDEICFLMKGMCAEIQLYVIQFTFIQYISNCPDRN